MKITLIPGDGIGPEVINQAVRVLDAVGQKYGCSFQYTKAPAGGNAIDDFGTPLPQSTIDLCLNSDAVLLGAVGGPKWDALPGELRPEKALLGIRKALGVFANLRPAVLFPQLKNASSLKPEIIEKGIDILVVRELIGGIYFGRRSMTKIDDGYEASDTELYTTGEIRRIAHAAFVAAMKRNKKVCSVDKANVLESSRLWRKVVGEVAMEYPEVSLTHMYVDNCAMQLVRDPHQFDVIVTSNMFGDILSDEASMLTGSLGMLPSASIGASNPGIFEPIHGSAPDIAGEDRANPIAAILSVAMMLKYSFDMENGAKAIEKAVGDVLDDGYRTADIMETGMTMVGTCEMGERIVEKIRNN